MIDKKTFDDVFEKRLDSPGTRTDAASDMLTRCPPSEWLEAFKKNEALLLPFEAGVVHMHIKECEICRARVQK